MKLTLHNFIFKDWITKHETDKSLAMCKLCKKPISNGNMGESALTSHSTGQKHVKMMSLNVSKGSGIGIYFLPKQKENCTPSAVNTTADSTSQSSVSNTSSDKNAASGYNPTNDISGATGSNSSISPKGSSMNDTSLNLKVTKAEVYYGPFTMLTRITRSIAI